MQDPIGITTPQKARRRKQFLIGLLIVEIIGTIFGYMLINDANQSRGVVNIVRGTGAELRTAFLGPSELEITWDDMKGKAWSVSLIEGRIRNVSNSVVKFDNVIYRIRDDVGNIIWKDDDWRFERGGSLKPMEYFNFATNPVSKRESEVFEIVIENAKVKR